MPNSPTTTPDVPIWPSGIARFNDGILEVTTGDGIRVPAHDVVDEPGDEAALRRLVHDVATMPGAA